MVRSVVLGFSRVFSRSSLRRSLLVAAAYAILSGGYTAFIIACVGLIGSLVRSNIAAVAFSSLMQVGVASFFAVFFMVYYYDIRVRREGLDLALAAAGRSFA